VVEQVEVVHPAEPAAQLDGERDMLARAAAPVRAGGLNQQVADDGTGRTGRIGGHGGADGVVVRPGQQRHVASVIA
jgi:hypothetical protein